MEVCEWSAGDCYLPVTLHTLYDHLLLFVSFPTHRTGSLTMTRSTLCVVVLPLTAKPWGGSSTIHAAHTPE